MRENSGPAGGGRRNRPALSTHSPRCRPTTRHPPVLDAVDPTTHDPCTVREAKSGVCLMVGIPLAALLALLLKRVPHRIYRRRWRGDVVRSEIPEPDAPWPEIARFPLGFDGFAAHGGPVPLGDYANGWRVRWAIDGTLPGDLAGLRAWFLFEQRRFNHFGYSPEGDDDRYVRALLEAIRMEFGHSMC